MNSIASDCINGMCREWVDIRVEERDSIMYPGYERGLQGYDFLMRDE
jgi:hypothetical protein